MEFVIITGMSGAGKTGALHVLEDIGYYCVDNLPSSLLSTLYDLCLKSEDDSMKRVAVVVDVRGNEKFEEMCSQIERFKRRYENVKVLFFDATTDRLVVRYKETRRRHPLSEKLKDGSVLSAVELERELLLPVKRTADYNIDTTYM
ncbi:RNase adapter RapZ, partial [Ruminococcus bromii]